MACHRLQTSEHAFQDGFGEDLGTRRSEGGSSRHWKMISRSSLGRLLISGASVCSILYCGAGALMRVVETPEWGNLPKKAVVLALK